MLWMSCKIPRIPWIHTIPWLPRENSSSGSNGFGNSETSLEKGKNSPFQRKQLLIPLGIPELWDIPESNIFHSHSQIHQEKPQFRNVPIGNALAFPNFSGSLDAPLGQEPGMAPHSQNFPESWILPWDVSQEWETFPKFSRILDHPLG